MRLIVLILLTIIPFTNLNSYEDKTTDRNNFYLFYKDENVTIYHSYDIDTINYGVPFHREEVYEDLLYYYKKEKK